MSVIAYNGVALGFVRTKSFAQEAVFLGPDVAKFRYTATVEVLIHRLTAGTDRGNLPPANPGGVGPLGPDGLAAWNAVHDRLMARRRPFVWRMATGVVANVPAGGFGPAGNGDVEWGPVPLKLVVLGFNSLGSAVAEYTIQWTAPNPCPNRNGVQAFLAHVWKSDDQIDREFFLTRTYTGVIALDPRVVGAQSGPLGIHPDAIRTLFLPPRTPGMHREETAVRTSEDGYTLAYKVVDRQPTAIVNSAHVARMEARHTVTNNDVGVASRATREADAITTGAAALGGFGAPWTAGANILVQRARLAVARYSPRNVPTATHEVAATAFGHPASQYHQLARAARAVVLFRFRQAVRGEGGRLLTFDGSFQQSDQSNPKATTCTLTVSMRPAQLYSAPIANVVPDPGQVDPVGPDPDADRVWNAGRPLMPRIVGGVIQPRPIVGPFNEAVPVSIRNLVYGGSVLNTLVDDGWGWVSAAFAPDLMSDQDASLGPQGFGDFVRFDGRTGRGVAPRSGGPMTATLIQVLQDPCRYKEPAPFLNTADREALP